jgi:toxin-antitoxin system PIN domain toxin
LSQTLDANVLLYASDGSSPFQARAVELLERIARGPEIAYLFWPAVMAYLRISTHASVFARPLSVTEAIANIEQLIDRPHIRSPGEQERFWSHYRAVADDAAPTGNLVPDAQIVALMRDNQVRTIWTHDRDYRRFPGIEVRDPFV